MAIQDRSLGEKKTEERQGRFYRMEPEECRDLLAAMEKFAEDAEAEGAELMEIHDLKLLLRGKHPGYTAAQEEGR